MKNSTSPPTGLRFLGFLIVLIVAVLGVNVNSGSAPPTDTGPQVAWNSEPAIVGINPLADTARFVSPTLPDYTYYYVSVPNIFSGATATHSIAASKTANAIVIGIGDHHHIGVLEHAGG